MNQKHVYSTNNLEVSGVKSYFPTDKITLVMLNAPLKTDATEMSLWVEFTNVH